MWSCLYGRNLNRNAVEGENPLGSEIRLSLRNTALEGENPAGTEARPEGKPRLFITLPSHGEERPPRKGPAPPPPPPPLSPPPPSPSIAVPSRSVPATELPARRHNTPPPPQPPSHGNDVIYQRERGTSASPRGPSLRRGGREAAGLALSPAAAWLRGLPSP